MDRDHRSERTELARAALVDGVGEPRRAASAAVEASYAAGLTDEFVKPFVLGDAGLRIAQGDPLVFFNFRPDRARQICHALQPALGLLVTMTRYDDTLGALVAFDDAPLHGTLADALEAAGLRQLHVAETEKYAHVTYFFDGGREQRTSARTGSSSPRAATSPTYDHAPEMSAAGVAQRFAERFGDGYAFAVVNLANPDMVGHTGVLPAVIAGVEASDAALGVILAAVERRGRRRARDRRPRQRRADARARRLAAHGAHHESRAARRHAGGRAPARRRQARRPRADGARPARAARRRRR